MGRIFGKLRWWAYQVLYKIASLRNPLAEPTQLPQIDQRSIWVFVSTIGELNMVRPLLDQVLQQHKLPLVLIADRTGYHDAYSHIYPSAHMVELDGSVSAFQDLAINAPPALFIVAEIPASLSDAPCRLPYAALRYARQAGSKVVLVNAWLYGNTPDCTMDHVERAWFNRQYLQSFDLITTQDDRIRSHLISNGANSNTTFTTGNMKLDAMRDLQASAANSTCPTLLESISQSKRPVIVGGCVTEPGGVHLFLSSFVRFRVHYPDALLVLAPRHSENQALMTELEALLLQYGLQPIRRSEHGDHPITSSTVSILLDTFGELRDFYRCATIAHVGINHNVLEPIALGKPVTVRGNWERNYPSYPVFKLAKESGAIQIATDADQLAVYWMNIMKAPQEAARDQLAFISRHQGASHRNLELLNRLCPIENNR